MSVLEKVSFQLNPGVSDEEFVQASRAIDSWVQPQPGFEYRALAKQSDGTWLDLVFWRDMDSAAQAGEQFKQASELGSVMALIDKTSVDVQHAPVLSQLAAQ